MTIDRFLLKVLVARNRLPWYILVVSPQRRGVWSKRGGSRVSFLPGSLRTGAARARWTRSKFRWCFMNISYLVYPAGFCNVSGRFPMTFFDAAMVSIAQLEPWNHYQPSSRPVSVLDRTVLVNLRNWLLGISWNGLESNA